MAQAHPIVAGASSPVRPRTATPTKFVAAVNQYFYFGMSLLVAAIVAYAFSQTVGRRLLHPALAPPKILWAHAGLFSAWVLFFIVQSALVRTRNVKIHRSAGWFGVALGVAMIVVGPITAVVMNRFHMGTRDGDDGASMLVPLWDIVAFTASFGLAVYWRKKPEFHRRLMLIATCVLTAAAFGRLMPSAFYAGVDVLICFGVLRDWIVNRRIHAVYRYALPALIVGQSFVMYSVVHDASWLRAAAQALRG